MLLMIGKDLPPYFNKLLKENNSINVQKWYFQLLGFLTKVK